MCNKVIRDFAIPKPTFASRAGKIAQRMAASTSGKLQYPRTHTDWKKLIFPFNNRLFRVTTPEPTLWKMDGEWRKNHNGALIVGALEQKSRNYSGSIVFVTAL